MQRSREKMIGWTRMATLLALLVAGTVFLAVTERGAGGSPAAVASPAPQLLRPAGYIDLPGPKGKRFDYLTIDASRNLLFSTHLGAGLLYVIDLRSNKVVKTLEDLPGIEGLELAPVVKKANTSTWLENKMGSLTSGR